MENRTAIITGATRGIGRGIFRRLAAQRCNVATIYHKDEESARRFEKEAKESGIQYMIERMDVRELITLAEFAAAVSQKFRRIDYLINNVGIDNSKNIYDLSLDEWRLSQDIILNAPFIMSKAVLPYMRRQKFGRIVNIGASSRDYSKGAPGMGVYGIHKAALNVFTRTLALEEIKNGITVNTVAPGSTDGAGNLLEEERIPISNIPLGRRVLVEEVVDAVMYFLADSANAVTGQFIGVNGGLST
ncbi:MAG: SDR family oxidoreductase [Dehalococcoidia bacterium]|nr:SDR family oxidoreductase [Dehalococcoidia bacterium]